jgi:Na+/H+ antiporter NhaC
VRGIVGKLMVGLALSLFLWMFMIQVPSVHAQAVTKGDGVKDIRIEIEGRFVRDRVYNDKTIKLTVIGFDGKALKNFKGPITLTSGTEAVVKVMPKPVKGVYTVKNWSMKGQDLTVGYKGRSFSKMISVASWLCLLPPLIAIGLALMYRQVLIALFGGIWLGHATITVTTPGWSFSNFAIDGFGFFSTLSGTIIGSMADADHSKIILFTLLMGGMVGIIAASGAMKAIVEIIAKYATSPKQAQLSTAGMGIAIFFDDYANTILVGNTMRPFTDRFRVSREKLAYIVDSTAAPVAALFLVSTWIGYEVGLIDDMLKGSPLLKGEAYSTFLASIPYRFYSIFGLVMVFAVAITGKDFGPMLKAEQRARHEGKVYSDTANPLMDENAMGEFDTKKPGSALLAVLPITSLVIGILGFMLYTGFAPAQANGRARLNEAAAIVGVKGKDYDSFVKLWTVVSDTTLKDQLSPDKAEKWQYLLDEANRQSGFSGVFSEASSYNALVWGAGLGCFVAMLLCMGGGFLSLEDTMKAFVNGLRSMLLAVAVLILAWGLGQVCKDLATGQWLAEKLKHISPALLPTLVFFLSAVIAFSTGTSWGTMAIVFPILGPLLAQNTALPAFEGIFFGSVGAVLAGSCFGDHASPISDTTVLSSMSSGSDHIDHVRTQVPYALYCAAIATVFGFLPAGFGMNPWIGLVLGVSALIGGLIVIGKRAEDPIEGSKSAATVKAAGKEKGGVGAS